MHSSAAVKTAGSRRATDRRLARSQVLLAVIGPIGVAVLLGNPAPALAALSDPRPDAVVTAVAVLVATALTWALLVWAVAVILAIGCSRLPGAFGAAGRRAFRAVTPAVVRAVLTTAVGVSVTVGLSACGGPATAATAPAAMSVSAAGDLAPGTADGAGANSVAAPWSAPFAAPAPAPAGAPGSRAAFVASPTPADAWIPDTTGSRYGATIDLDWPLSSPESGPSAPTAEPPGAAADAPVTVTVTVRSGDSLWSIAADHLPTGANDAQIDTAWREWYRLNQSVIGADPNLVIPGQVLRTPGHERAADSVADAAPDAAPDAAAPRTTQSTTDLLLPTSSGE